MQMEVICIIIYKMTLQILHGEKSCISYGEFQMGIYNLLIISSLIFLYIIDLFSFRLQTIHEKDFIHRDFHSGNILIETIESEICKIDQYLIGDLGLSQPTNSTSSANEIYGVIPYIAPEIF